MRLGFGVAMSIADTRRQGGRAGKAPNLGSKEVQLPEAKLWFVTAQDSPSKNHVGQTSQTSQTIPSVSQAT